MKSNNAKKESIPIAYQSSRMPNPLNYMNASSNQYLMGKTVSNTVIPEQAKVPISKDTHPFQRKRSNSLDKKNEIKSKDKNIPQVKNNNNSPNIIKNSKTSMVVSNNQNKLKYTQPPNNPHNIQISKVSGKSQFNKTVVKGGKKICNIDLNSDTQDSQILENEKENDNDSDIEPQKTKVDLQNNPTVESINFSNVEIANSVIEPQDEKLLTVTQMIKEPPTYPNNEVSNDKTKEQSKNKQSLPKNQAQSVIQNNQNQAIKNTNIQPQNQIAQTVNPTLNKKSSPQANQNLDVQSKNQNINPSQQTAHSQLQNIHSQHQSVIPSKQVAQSQQQAMNPQLQNIQSPQHQGINPQQHQGMNAPQQSLHPQHQGINPTQQNMQSQNKNMNPPQQSVQLQHQGMNPQQQNMQSPNKNVNSQVQSTISQNQGINTQQQSLQIQNKNMNSQHQGINPQKQNIQSQNKNMNSQQQNINSHQPNINPQQQNMISPNQIMNTHQASQQNVNQPQQNIQHIQQNIKTPNQSMIPQNQSNQNPNLNPKNIQPTSQQDTNTQGNNKSMRPETQNPNIQKEAQNPNIIQKESADRLQKRNSLRASRNKSPPQIRHTKDGQIKRPVVDASGNHYYITTENDTIPSDSYICSNLNEYLDKEIMTQKSINEKPKNNKSGSGFRYYGQLTKAGRKQNGETKVDQDTPLVHLNVGGIPGFNLFGVLDGHGPEGHFVSQFCRDYFIKKMTYYAELCKQKGLKTPEVIFNELKRTKYAYIIQIFTQADSEIALQSFDYWFSGTTCNITFQFNRNLINASVGDSRSILVFDGGDNQLLGIQPLSTDHKPDIPCELNRILSKGGCVDQITGAYGNKVGPQRVWKAGQNYPGLAMSRSLGDFHAKECGVISYPQIVEKTLDKSSKYLVICSDGVWEFIQNEQVRDLGNVFFKKNDVGGFCSDLVKFAVHSWENFDIIRDDITVVCVYF